MGTDVLAVIFLVSVMIMAATVAVMTVIYASRLPSSKKSSGLGPNTKPRVDDVPSHSRKQSKLRAQQAASNSPPAPKQEENRDEPTDPGPQTAALPKASADEAPNSNQRRKPRSNMGLFSKRPKAGPPTEAPKVNSSLTAEREAPSSTVEKASPAGQSAVEGVPAAPIVGRTLTKPEAELVDPGNQPRGSEETPRAPASSQQAEKANAAATDAPNPPLPPKENAATAGPTPELQKPPEPQTAKVPEDITRGKSVMGDLSELFAKNTSDDSKANKLAEGMAEVDVNDLVKAGLGLIGKLKKPGNREH